MSTQTAVKKPFFPVRTQRHATMPTRPQVNLLPPEVQSSRQLSETKRWLVLVLAGVLAAVGIGFGYSLWQSSQADHSLAAAQQQQTILQGQLKQYHDVTQVLDEIDQVGAKRKQGMADDVIWRSYLDAITAVLPAGVSIDAATITGPDPTVSMTATSTGPLTTAGIGKIALTLRSSTVPDTAALVDALGSIAGLASPAVSAVTLTAGADDGSAYYAVTGTVIVTDTALSHRFDKQGN